MKAVYVTLSIVGWAWTLLAAAYLLVKLPRHAMKDGQPMGDNRDDRQ